MIPNSSKCTELHQRRRRINLRRSDFGPYRGISARLAPTAGLEWNAADLSSPVIDRKSAMFSRLIYFSELRRAEIAPWALHIRTFLPDGSKRPRPANGTGSADTGYQLWRVAS